MPIQLLSVAFDVVKGVLGIIAVCSALKTTVKTCEHVDVVRRDCVADIQDRRKSRRDAKEAQEVELTHLNKSE